MIDRFKTGHEAMTDVTVGEQRITRKLHRLFSVNQAARTDGEYADVDGVMRNIFKEVMQNPDRKGKYEKFITNAFKLNQLWKSAGLPQIENRFQAFLLIYFQQRLFDDIVDGDTPQRLAPADRVAYARIRLENLKTGNFDEGNPIDAFAIKILSDIAVIDPSHMPKAKQRLGQIMGSIAFDGERICAMEISGTWKFSSGAELEKHFSNLDINGVIGLTLFLFGFKDSVYNLKLLAPLAKATRIAYNIRDFSSDIRAGLCNIPREDADRYKITDADLRKVVAARHMAEYPRNVANWLLGQVARGNELLRLHAKQPITSNMESSAVLHTMRVRDMRLPLYREVVANRVLQTGYIDEARKVFRDATRELR